jgi:hypothetical protein
MEREYTLTRHSGYLLNEQHLRIHVFLTLNLQESLLVVPRNDLSLRGPHQVLQSLRRTEPGWVISCEPPLWYAISPLEEGVSIHRE